jgi:hypothetical protein
MIKIKKSSTDRYQVDRLKILVPGTCTWIVRKKDKQTDNYRYKRDDRYCSTQQRVRSRYERIYVP